METLVLPEEEIKTKPTLECQLILHNDDFNPFNHVVECLVKYCNHTEEQALQCAYIVHHKGRFSIKNGARKKLIPIKEALQENNLTVTIE